MEEWRDIPGYEGYYQVSNIGRIKRISTDHILKPWCSKRGVKSVNLCKMNTCRTTRVHVIVASTFIGEKPKGMEICHNNGDCTDNRLENLRYDTHKNNELDKKKHGTSQVGENHGMSKLNNIQVKSIRHFLKLGYLSIKDIASVFDISTFIVWSISKNKLWKHI